MSLQPRKNERLIKPSLDEETKLRGEPVPADLVEVIPPLYRTQLPAETNQSDPNTQPSSEDDPEEVLEKRVKQVLEGNLFSLDEMGFRVSIDGLHEADRDLVRERFMLWLLALGSEFMMMSPVISKILDNISSRPLTEPSSFFYLTFVFAFLGICSMYAVFSGKPFLKSNSWQEVQEALRKVSDAEDEVALAAGKIGLAEKPKNKEKEERRALARKLLEIARR